jgi:hypothetical protein
LLLRGEEYLDVVFDSKYDIQAKVAVTLHWSQRWKVERQISYGDKEGKHMAGLHELRTQINPDKTAVLIFKDENNENTKVFVGMDAQGRYTHTFSYPDRPNSFPRPRMERYLSWKQLIEDIEGLQTISDQWSIE